MCKNVKHAQYQSCAEDSDPKFRNAMMTLQYLSPESGTVEYNCDYIRVLPTLQSDCCRPQCFGRVL